MCPCTLDTDKDKTKWEFSIEMTCYYTTYLSHWFFFSNGESELVLLLYTLIFEHHLECEGQAVCELYLCLSYLSQQQNTLVTKRSVQQDVTLL